MSWIDIGIVAIILYQAAIGFQHGSLRGVLDLVGLVAALTIATTQLPRIAQRLAELLPVSMPVARWLSFLIGVSLLMLVFQGAANLASRLFRRQQSWTDRIGGLVFGSVRGLVKVSFFLVLMTLMPMSAQWAAQLDQSPLGPSALAVVPMLYNTVAPRFFPQTHEFYTQFGSASSASSTVNPPSMGSKFHVPRSK